MKASKSIAFTWGSTLTERAMAFPCDSFLLRADCAYFRAVDILAPAHTIFQWLCQLRSAPYSYDWIDNFGRQSPRYLNPALENLEVGQRVMTIFRLVEFEPDRHLTLVMASAQAIAIFGEIAVSYIILPQTARQCRLVAKLLVRYPKSGLWSLMRCCLPWGDVLMMRKQLLTIKYLAESQSHEQL